MKFKNKTKTLFPGRRAEFSSCGRYRYALWRRWPQGNGTMMIIGLNPSKANSRFDDPTIRKAIGYAQRANCAELCMTNLFAYRSTDPKEMKAQRDPIGPDNNKWLSHCAASAKIIVAAWGMHGSHKGRDHAVRALFPNLTCLAKTKAGLPRHPLYLKASLVPKPL